MKQWQRDSIILKEALSLDTEPVAVCVEEKAPLSNQKVRICRAIIDAAGGKTLTVGKGNNACFGAAWHLGFRKIEDPKVLGMIKKFVVEGEKLFSSYEALENLLAQMEDVPTNSHTCFVMSPLGKAEHKPQLVIFVCNSQDACRLLTLVTFIDGRMPEIKIGGPTCRMAIMYPLLRRKVNLSFYDYTARKICNVDKDKLLVAIPYEKIPLVVGNLDKCSAGRAKIEYPQGFQELLQSQKRGDSLPAD